MAMDSSWTLVVMLSLNLSIDPCASLVLKKSSILPTRPTTNPVLTVPLQKLGQVRINIYP